MKKLIASLLLVALSVSLFATPGLLIQEKKYRIHTEKRTFIKKGERRGHHKQKHKHHQKKKKMGERKHFKGKYKK